jgi:hypothetical protein
MERLHRSLWKLYGESRRFHRLPPSSTVFHRVPSPTRRLSATLAYSIPNKTLLLCSTVASFHSSSLVHSSLGLHAPSRTSK